MAKTNGRAALMDAIEGDQPMDAEKAQAAINADRDRRAKEYSEIIQREGQRLKCKIVGTFEAIGNQSATGVRIIAE